MKDIRYYTIYKITNKINNMIYIGAHITSNPYDNYYGSGLIIKRAIKKYGNYNFHKEVLFIFDNKEDMLKKEKELVNIDFISNPNTYNINIGGGDINLDGYVFVYNEKNEIIKISNTDPRYLSGEFLPTSKKRAYGKDTNGKIYQVCKHDRRFITNELTKIKGNKWLKIDFYE